MLYISYIYMLYKIPVGLYIHSVGYIAVHNFNVYFCLRICLMFGCAYTSRRYVPLRYTNAASSTCVRGFGVVLQIAVLLYLRGLLD